MTAALALVVAALGAWEQVDIIAGHAAGALFGSRVSLSSDGHCIASYNMVSGTTIKPVVYQWNGTVYLPLNSMYTMSCSATCSQAATLAMSGDCTTAAFGDGISVVSIFERNATKRLWEEHAYIEITDATFGTTIALPAVGTDIFDGTTPMLIGATTATGDDDDGLLDAGVVYAYKVPAFGTTALVSSTFDNTGNIAVYGAHIEYARDLALTFLVVSFVSSSPTAVKGTVYTSADNGTTVVAASAFTTACSSQVGINGAISSDGLWVALACPAGSTAHANGVVALYNNNTLNVILAEDAAKFGASVSFGGARVVVGTNGYTLSTTSTYAYNYERSSDGAWVGADNVTGAPLEDTGHTGNIQARLSQDGTLLAVGIPSYDTQGELDGVGQLLVYTQTPPPPPPSSARYSGAVLGGAIGGALAGGILIAAVAYAVHWRLSKNRYKSVDNAI
jgi:hypothetical protein